MEGSTAFPGLLHFTLDSYVIALSVKQGSIKFHFFESLVTQLGIEPWSPGVHSNNQTMSGYIYIYIHTYIYIYIYIYI